MKKSTCLALAAGALLALPVLSRAEDAKACCAASTASAQSQCAAGKSACCAAGQSVMIKVKGRHADQLQAALTRLDGVTSVSTCPESKFTTVAYNKDKVCADKIMAAVQDTGCKVETRRVSFAVEGLSCGACADKATKALAKVKGVSNAKVCSESKMATVDFNPGKAKTENLAAALQAVGFKASESLN